MRILIATDTYYPDINGASYFTQRLAAGLHERGHDVHVGFVADDDLPAAYAAADVCVNPGTAELQSIVTLEAMASGKPVVEANARALPLLVRDGATGTC